MRPNFPIQLSTFQNSDLKVEFILQIAAGTTSTFVLVKTVQVHIGPFYVLSDFMNSLPSARHVWTCQTLSQSEGILTTNRGEPITPVAGQMRQVEELRSF